jgi:hypothetical protein
MNAVDTNVLIYACDQTDVRRQRLALDLITTSPDCVLLWQVACEFIAASRKLNKQGFTDSGHPSPSSGTARQPKRVVLGRPHSGRVRRGRRGDPVLGGPAGYERHRLGARRQSVRVAGYEGAEPLPQNADRVITPRLTRLNRGQASFLSERRPGSRPRFTHRSRTPAETGR